MDNIATMKPPKDSRSVTSPIGHKSMPSAVSVVTAPAQPSPHVSVPVDATPSTTDTSTTLPTTQPTLSEPDRNSQPGCYLEPPVDENPVIVVTSDTPSAPSTSHPFCSSEGSLPAGLGPMYQTSATDSRLSVVSTDASSIMSTDSAGTGSRHSHRFVPKGGQDLPKAPPPKKPGQQPTSNGASQQPTSNGASQQPTNNGASQQPQSVRVLQLANNGGQNKLDIAKYRSRKG